MSDSMIKVDGLGKSYIISHQQSGAYTTLRDVISRKTSKLLKGKNNLPAREEFWALKDVSFEIKKGEAVGIIGRNGAGKSTLLKILSRITEPSTGRIELNGRVASLLEVGTGFHPELTGRENIFLNGAILGMTRVEIRKKFDEIVDFSGVEKFLDTPVKRYSSGMYVRLAFAVAAHLEPEILVVDEVLAVGDAEFQKKCLGKMNDVSKNEGRTVLFVSHNMPAIEVLCDKGIFLTNGQVSSIGEINTVISDYYSQTSAQGITNKHVELVFADDTRKWAVNSKLTVKFNFPAEYTNSFIDLTFYDNHGARLFSLHGTRNNRLKVSDINEINLFNPGIVNSSISVDLGLKRDEFDNYFLLERNAFVIETSVDDESQLISGNLKPRYEIEYSK